MSDFERLTDAELVSAFRAGDQAAFAGIYDRYADHVYSYVLTMLRSPETAAEVTHDTFLDAATRLGQLEKEVELRSWLFAIARSEARAEGRHRARSGPEVDQTETSGDDPESAVRAKQAELRALVWQAVDGLGERDRELMALHLVEGLEGEDLAEVMGIESSRLDELVSRMRGRVRKVLGPLLIARLGSEDCDELDRVLGDWDGEFDPTVRAGVTRHIGGCEICQERRAFLVAPASVLAGIMVVAAPPALRERVEGEVVAIFDTRSEETVPTQKSGGLSEMTELAIFALVTIVVGLIGIAVSAQFDPLDQPVVSDPDDGQAASSNTTTTTTTPGTTSSTVSVGTTSPEATSPVSPGAIEVSVDTVDFGDDQTTGRFDIVNTGGEPVEFTAESSVETVVLSSGGEELGPGETVTYDVILDRDEVAEGEITETITLTWDGETAEIAVTGVHLDNPILHNPQASPSQVDVSGSDDCSNTDTTISVRVRDRSPLESVVAQWSPDGGSTRETPMTEVGGDIFETEIGPFTTVHTASVRIVATDELGNAGGATIGVEVLACP